MADKPKFDPSKPFTVADSGKPKFDPNQAFTAAEEASVKPTSMLDTEIPLSYRGIGFQSTTPRGLIQGGLNALPAAGQLAGGTIGAAGGTLAEPGLGTVAGGVGGAALGTAAGESLKNLGEQYLLGKNKTRAEIYGNPVKGAVEGAYGQMGGEALNAGAKAVASTPLVQKAVGAVGKVGAKVASSLSGVPQKEIETYAKNAKEINKMASSADYDSQHMADKMREKFNGKIQETRQALNKQISDTLKSRTGDIVEVTPIIDELEKAKGQINAKLHPEDIANIDEMIGKVQSVADGKDKVSAQHAHDLKQYLQDVASGSYQKNGQIFQSGKSAERAAKSGGAKARELLNKAAPEVAEANDQLANLHDIEDTMNRNLLAEGKTAASLYAAGKGEEGNVANAKVIERLSEATGHDMTGDVDKLSAARTFGRPSLLPVDTTGKSLTRMGVAGVGGYLLGGVPGALVAEGIGSPAGLKAGINAGRYGLLAGKSLLNNSPAMQGLLVRQGLVRGR